MNRDAIYQKLGGLCAYSGTPLEEDWQVEHIIPKRRGGDDDISNLMPVQRILNHYKRALTLEEFRVLWLGCLHKRLAKLPKNPRTENGQRRKDYLLKVASYFGIKSDKPFSGEFYFETVTPHNKE